MIPYATVVAFNRVPGPPESEPGTSQRSVEVPAGAALDIESGELQDHSLTSTAIQRFRPWSVVTHDDDEVRLICPSIHYVCHVIAIPLLTTLQNTGTCRDNNCDHNTWRQDLLHLAVKRYDFHSLLRSSLPLNWLIDDRLVQRKPWPGTGKPPPLLRESPVCPFQSAVLWEESYAEVSITV